MYYLEGIYAEKIMPNGQILRFKNYFKITLNTENGVLEFIKDMKPFSQIKITDPYTKEDFTEHFLSMKEQIN